MDLTELRTYRDLGAIHGLKAQHFGDSGDLSDPRLAGWVLGIKTSNGTFWLQTARGEVRTFGALDTLVRLLADEGLSPLEVVTH